MSKKDNSVYYKKLIWQNIEGTLLVFFGFLFATLFFISFVGVFLLQIVLKWGSLLNVILGIITVFLLNFLFFGLMGRKILLRIERFHEYCSCIGDMEFYSIEKLAEDFGATEEFILNDVKEMINDKWFLQGHLDPSEKYVLVTDIIYENFNQEKFDEEKI